MTTPAPGNAWSRYGTCLKWSLMTAAIFWIVIFKLSQARVELPDFVYVNF